MDTKPFVSPSQPAERAQEDRYVVLIPAYKPDARMLKLVRELRAEGLCVQVVDDGSGETYRDIFDQAQALGCRVEYLKRISMGPLILDPNLEPGEYRPLTLQEEASIKDCGNRGNRV